MSTGTEMGSLGWKSSSPYWKLSRLLQKRFLSRVGGQIRYIPGILCFKVVLLMKATYWSANSLGSFLNASQISSLLGSTQVGNSCGWCFRAAMQSFFSRPSLVQHSAVPECTGNGESCSQDLADSADVQKERRKTSNLIYVYAHIQTYIQVSRLVVLHSA